MVVVVYLTTGARKLITRVMLFIALLFWSCDCHLNHLAGEVQNNPWVCPCDVCLNRWLPWWSTWCSQNISSGGNLDAGNSGLSI